MIADLVRRALVTAGAGDAALPGPDQLGHTGASESLWRPLNNPTRLRKKRAVAARRSLEQSNPWACAPLNGFISV
jgi:hypothetical protein